MPNRAPDWLRQADRDFEQALDSRHAERHVVCLNAGNFVNYPQVLTKSNISKLLVKHAWRVGDGSL